MNKSVYVYCSGALFSPEDLKAMRDISNQITSIGFHTFLPHYDGLEAFVLNQANSSISNSILLKPIQKFINKAIFALDIYQIISVCDYFVINLNGRIPDDGAVVELGLAIAYNKPIIIYQNDLRAKYNNLNNLSIMGAIRHSHYINSLSEISEIIKKISLADYPPVTEYPDNIKRQLEFGEKVWKFIQKINFFKPKNKMDFL